MDGAFVKLDEITVKDFKEKDLSTNFNGPLFGLRRLPWVSFQSASKWQYFYYSPYNFNMDHRTITLRGLIITADRDLAFKTHELFKVYFADAKGNNLAQDVGRSYANKLSDKNIVFFEVHGEIDGDKSLTELRKLYISVRDEQGTVIAETEVQPKWKTKLYYNIPRDRPQRRLTPTVTLEKFIRLGVENRDKQSAFYLIPLKIRKQFPWENLDHQYWQSNRYQFYLTMVR